MKNLKVILIYIAIGIAIVGGAASFIYGLYLMFGVGLFYAIGGGFVCYLGVLFGMYYATALKNQRSLNNPPRAGYYGK